MSRPTTDFATRFWAKVKRAGPDDCWNWQGSRCGLHAEYGQTFYNGHRLTAHRGAWLLSTGTLPLPRLEVCHSCDNPLCCNPSHLWIGTHKQNMEDKAAKGRSNVPFGSNTGNSKLSEFEVAQIKRLLKSGLSQRKIAKQFSVSQPTISYIKNGLHWTHHELQEAA